MESHVRRVGGAAARTRTDRAASQLWEWGVRAPRGPQAPGKPGWGQRGALNAKRRRAGSLAPVSGASPLRELEDTPDGLDHASAGPTLSGLFLPNRTPCLRLSQTDVDKGGTFAACQGFWKTQWKEKVSTPAFVQICHLAFGGTLWGAAAWRGHGRRDEAEMAKKVFLRL